MDIDKWKNLRVGPDAALYTNFNNELYDILSSETLDVVQHGCSIVKDKCINGLNEAGSFKKRSKKIDTSFLTPGTSCLKLGSLEGDFDCKYWLADGLRADIAEAKKYANTAMRSAIRQKAAAWTVEADLMPDDRLEHTRQCAEVGLFFFHEFFLTFCRAV